MKPHRSSRSSSLTVVAVVVHLFGEIDMRTDGHQPGLAGSPSRRIASRGTGRPHPTSGQTGTVKNGPGCR